MDGTGREDFAAWLRQRLGKRTQGQLAQHVGVATSTVSRWMTGQATPEWHNIVRMAEYLEVAPETIRDLLPDPLATAQRNTGPAAASTPGAAVLELMRLTVKETLAQLVLSPENRDHRAEVLAILVDMVKLAPTEEDRAEIRRQEEPDGQGLPG